MRLFSKKMNENSYTAAQQKKNTLSKPIQATYKGVLNEINNNAEYINLYESGQSMMESYEDSLDTSTATNLNEQVKNIIQGSQEQFDGYFKRHSKDQKSMDFKPQNISIQSMQSRDKNPQKSCSTSRTSIDVRQKSQTSSRQESTMITQRDTPQYQQKYQQQQTTQRDIQSETEIDVDLDSRSPSPSKNFIHKQLQLHKYYCCNLHQNTIKDRAKNLRFICSDPYCDAHILCNSCLQDSLCLHENKLKVEDFLNQPILAFLDSGNEEDLIFQVVQQQSVLFNKVKTQAEQSKSILKNYFTTMCQELQTKTDNIFSSYEERVNNQLSSIRKQMDSIQEICNAYKNHFENLTLNIFEEAVDYPDTLIFKLKQSLQEFLIQSDNPKEQLLQTVQMIQANLNNIPHLKTQNMKTTYANLIDPMRMKYEHLIDDPFMKLESRFDAQLPLRYNQLQDFSMMAVGEKRGLVCLQYSDMIQIYDIDISQQDLQTNLLDNLQNYDKILKAQFMSRHQLLTLVRTTEKNNEILIVCPLSGQIKLNCQLDKSNFKHLQFIVETSSGKLILNRQDGSFFVINILNKDKISIHNSSMLIKGTQNVKYFGSQIMDTTNQTSFNNDDCEILIIYQKDNLSLYELGSLSLIKQCQFYQTQKITRIKVLSLEPFIIEFDTKNFTQVYNLETSSVESSQPFIWCAYDVGLGVQVKKSEQFLELTLI